MKAQFIIESNLLKSKSYDQILKDSWDKIGKPYFIERHYNGNIIRFTNKFKLTTGGMKILKKFPDMFKFSLLNVNEYLINGFLFNYEGKIPWTPYVWSEDGINIEINHSNILPFTKNELNKLPNRKIRK